MAGLLKREPRPADVFDRFDKMFDEWMRSRPFWRTASLDRDLTEDLIRVDEFRANGDLVVRAELPGIDPEADVDLTVTDGMLRIDARRRQEEEVEEEGYLRRELRYGAFTRTLPLPEGVTESDVKADYKDGMLEIRIPVPEPEPAKKIPITKG